MRDVELVVLVRGGPRPLAPLTSAPAGEPGGNLPWGDGGARAAAVVVVAAGAALVAGESATVEGPFYRACQLACWRERQVAFPTRRRGGAHTWKCLSRRAHGAADQLWFPAPTFPPPRLPSAGCGHPPEGTGASSGRWPHLRAIVCFVEIVIVRDESATAAPLPHRGSVGPLRNTADDCCPCSSLLEISNGPGWPRNLYNGSAQSR